MAFRTVIHNHGMPPPLPGYDRQLPALGAGANGAVFQERCLGGAAAGQWVAVKYLHRADLLNGENMTKFARELRIHLQTLHPHIAAFRRVELLGDWVCIVCELCDGKQNLLTWLSQYPRNQAPEQVVRGVAAQLLSALQHMHDQQLVHRDLKADNICLAAPAGPGVTPFLKLVDFGHSKDAKVNSIPNSVVGTPYYQAPEIYLAQLAEEDGLPAPPYDGEKVDVWALGVMLLILLRGDYPFPITQGKQYTRDGVLHQRLQLQVAQLAVSPQCAAFVCKCFTLEPAARPTVALLAADDWITAGGAQLAAAARGPAVCEQTAAEVEDVIRRVQQGLP